jgi:hypothetical protein
MAHKNGEMLFPLVDRDATGNATKLAGVLYANTASGETAAVYLGDDGKPTKAILGSYILLYSNWSTDGRTVDIAKIYTPTSYIELFKGVNINANLAAYDVGSATAKAERLNFSSVATPASYTCYPHCGSDTENLAEVLRIAGYAIEVTACGTLIPISLGAAVLPCAGTIVSTTLLAAGDEPWLQNLGDVAEVLNFLNYVECASGSLLECPGPALDLGSRALRAIDKISSENTGIAWTANEALIDPNRPSGIYQLGGGLPSCPAAYQCSPGTFQPCYHGLRQCSASCEWSVCVNKCGDGLCDTTIAGENSTNCPSDCQAFCGDGICAPGETTTCPSDCQVNSCCVSTGNCPSETPYECPGECCCCGWGSVCSASYVCS